MSRTGYFDKRIISLRSEMRKRNLDVFVSTFLPTLQYLCGYSGSNGLLIVSDRKTTFFTDFRYQEMMQSHVVADTKVVGKGSLHQLAVQKNFFSKVNSVGIEAGHITLADYEIVKKILQKRKLIDASGIVETLRSVKNGNEIQVLKRAFDISDKVFKKILSIIRPGIRELEVSAEISYYHKKYGAENDSFDVIVASGERGSLPHGTASLKKIANGEFVTLDFGCLVEGYHSDMTRTIAVGKPTQEMKKVYRIVLDAQEKAIDSVKSGISAKKIDNISRGYISKKSYGKYFGHSLGHGVGLEIHELPRVAPKSSDTLAEGHVITIEPGIYIPGKFGIRIEDTVVVKGNGHDNLTRSSKELIIL